jgi:hypothetical protein
VNLRDVIFTDGIIVSYKYTVDQLSLNFLDYTGDRIEIFFKGNVRFEDNDGKGFSLSDSRLTKRDHRYELQLFDDDVACVFRIEFDQADYRLTE